MPVYLLDTDHLSYLQRRHPKVVAKIVSLPPEDRIVTSVVAVGELLRGAYLLRKSRRQRELVQFYREMLYGMEEVLSLTRPVGEKFAEIDSSLRKRGTPIPINDVWVAALALVQGAVLVSNDRHFDHIDSLEVKNWTST